MRKTAAILMGVMLSSFVYAGNSDADSKGFLGLEFGAATVEGERLNDFNHQGSAVEYGLRLGAQNDEWRATFVFDYFDSTDDDQNVEKGLLLVDYFFFENDESGMSVRPFIGGNVGLVNYESTGVDATDFVYGGQGGVVIGVNENIDFDLSYRYSLSGSEQINNMGSLVFGFNYLY